MTRLRILHLSDTHLFGDERSRHYGVVDTAEHLRRALAHMTELSFDLVVCSGDLSEDGTAASYRRLRDLVLPWAQERGARAVFAMGNHDSRAAFRAVLGGGQPDAEERVLPATAGDPGSAPIASVADVSGWRVVVLDTSVPGRGYGALDDAQLEWLRAELARPAAHGTVLTLHHPPVKAQTDLLQALALGDDDAGRLLEAVRGSDVRVVLCGHYHLPLVETVGGIPIVIAPGITNLARAFEDPAEESAIEAFGGAVVEIEGDHVRILPFVQRTTPDAEVFHLNADAVAQIAAEAGRSEGP